MILFRQAGMMGKRSKRKQLQTGDEEGESFFDLFLLLFGLFCLGMITNSFCQFLRICQFGKLILSIASIEVQGTNSCITRHRIISATAHIMPNRGINTIPEQFKNFENTLRN